MNELAQIHSGREVIFSCLSKIFIDIPGEGFYDMLDTLVSATKLMKDGTSLSKSIEKLEDFIEKRKQLPPHELVIFDKDTIKTFTSLYCLTNSISSSESVYVSPSGLAMQETSEAVLRLYQKYAFDMEHYSNEAPDHISYELMFMAYLAKHTSKCITKNNQEKARMLTELQQVFFKDHMVKWVGSFSKATASRVAANLLYAPAAEFMTEYLYKDQQLLEYLIDNMGVKN